MPFPLLIPFFFFSAWLLMVFWGMVSPDIGVATVGYPRAMLVTIGLWLVVFPLARRENGKKGAQRGMDGEGKRASAGSQLGSTLKREMTKNFGRGSSSGSGESETVSDDEIDITSSFSGISRRLTSKNFRGGKVNTNFGGVHLDFTEASLAGNEAIIKVAAFIGGIEIKVPDGWEVQTNVSTTIGGVSDERVSKPSPGSGTQKLEITGSATMGGLRITD